MPSSAAIAKRQLVTDDVFDALGVVPAPGRTFGATDAVRSAVQRAPDANHAARGIV